MKQFIFIVLLIVAQQGFAQDPFVKVKEKTEAYEFLPLNEIKPSGWIKKQMQGDMNGFVGHLDQLVPDLIVKDDIYGENRLTKKQKTKNLGNNPEGSEWEVQYLWWNSETQSNWWDGYVRNAFFLNNSQQIEKVKKHVETILSTQDEDGYLGIYEPDLRYQFDVENGENGELWSKATLYRTLLAYYGFTGDQKVLDAVERAVQNVMDNYKINESSPFGVKKSFAGICHGLVFTDVLDQLHYLTGKPVYWDYALFLYKDYSGHDLSEKDIQYPHVIDGEYKLQGHGVHTYEHLRTLLVADFASGNPELERALQLYLDKVEGVTTLTGGAIGDEWIVGRKADPTYTGYEYCSLHELLDSYAQLVQKTGEISYAGRIENIFFNAAMGARHPEKSCIAYLKTDNSYEMTGGPNGSSDPNHKQTRYKYSPVHQDVAVCCVPNAGRITPYYVQNMWLKDKSGLIASLLGGSEVNTQWDGKNVSINEITDYPYSSRIRFEVEVSSPVSFVLKIRKPSWIKGFTLNADYREEGDFIVIRKDWTGKSVFTLDFNAEVEKHPFNQDVYFTYGSLVLALPIEAVEIPTKIYTKGFQDFEYKPKNRVLYQYEGGMPVKKGDQYKIRLYNPDLKKTEEKTLVPIAKTVLRQVTFGSK